jgi:tetratricopeptide (TPR) repeat protein
VSAAKREYVTEDAAANVEYVRRNEEVAAAARALRADPGNAYQMWRVARACAHAGDPSQAVQHFRQSAGSFATREMIEQALEVYLEMIQYDETAVLPAPAQLKMAQVLEPTHLPEAVAAYERLVEYYPVLPETEQALVRLAVIYQKILERPHESLRCLNQLLDRFPYGQSAAWAGQARAYLNQRLRPGGGRMSPPAGSGSGSEPTVF